MLRVGWDFTDDPVSVGAMDPHGNTLAIAWAAPITFIQPDDLAVSEQGINLAYAVQSQYERQGMASATCALVLVEAQRSDAASFVALVGNQYKSNLRRNVAYSGFRMPLGDAFTWARARAHKVFETEHESDESTLQSEPTPEHHG